LAFLERFESVLVAVAATVRERLASQRDGIESKPLDDRQAGAARDGFQACKEWMGEGSFPG
jgi:hypothetical protein